MKSSFDTHTAIAAGLSAFVALALVSAAPLRGAETNLTSAEAAARMAAARTEIATTRSNIVLTLETLHEIRYASDRNAQVAKFTNQLAKMIERAEFTRGRAQEMERRGDAYFTEWEARNLGIQDPERRRDAEAGYADRKKSYDRITRSMRQAGRDFTPLLAMLQEVKRLLEGTRTEQNVTAARNLFQRATWACTDVQRSLMEVEIELDVLEADFAGREGTTPTQQP